MCQNSTTAKHESVRCAQGLKHDAIQTKCKHTQQGTTWSTLYEGIASLSCKTLTSNKLKRILNPSALSLLEYHSRACLQAAFFSHQLLRLTTMPRFWLRSPTIGSPLSLWQHLHRPLAGGSVTVIWQASSWGDPTHRSRCWHTPHPDELIQTTEDF